MDLPPGLTSRPLALTDAAAVTAVMAASEAFDIGEVVIEEADIVGDWQRPSYDVATSTLGVFDGQELVAYADVCGGDRCDAAVHPDYRRRGLGTALARWMEDLARSRGERVLGSPVPEGSPADDLLASLGYRVRWTSWVLELPVDAQVADRPLPTGFQCGVATEAEHAAVHATIEDAFLEWSVRERQTFEDFAAQILRRPGFAPWQLRVVRDQDGSVVGAAVVMLVEDRHEGYVDKLAVRRDCRGRGLAQALLVDAFGAAREYGATRCTLNTDSRTGALSLYQKVGMQIASVWVNRAVDL